LPTGSAHYHYSADGQLQAFSGAECPGMAVK
jgi:hypothetical protein